ncbi:uncharacterized protein LOC127721209 [Mytilus californianus]|uniref:uncharacterized protein LOC127721209 n=1 Tax=Mytilus californianus TaxID=6549 RepID=UPI002245CFBC|nr:uncharacterized protein LOC127721209 [Mytilus californianus]
MVSKEENDSRWLFDVLDIIGANDEFRKSCQRAHIMQEIFMTFQNQNSMYLFGSACEGSITPGHEQDADYIECDEKFPVIEDISKDSSQYQASLLVITEEDTPVGYVKLQLVIEGTRQTVMNWPYLQQFVRKDIVILDKNGRILLFDLPTQYRDGIFSRRKNKPALTIENMKMDLVRSYRCTAWPTIATEWLTRRRCYGWPTEDTIQEMKSFGFFVIKKGHPCSPEKDLEWRISFSLQERKLMFSLTDVQYKCYIVLKMINRDVIKLNEFTSYHWKTCLFYAMEQNDRNVWEKRNLFYCVKLCLKQMLKWLKCGNCPNYFIPGDNLFDGKLNNNRRLKAANEIEHVLNMGFNCFLRVKSNDICNYLQSRESLERSKRLQSHSKDVYEKTLKQNYLSSFASLFKVFNHNILQHYYYQSNGNTDIFIKYLWDTLEHIKEVRTVTEHTEEETRSVLTLMIPHILTCLASNISAMAIQHPNPQVRDFLLFGSFTFFMQAGLLGRLKFISVLYAIQLYKDCEWCLDQLDEEHIKIIPSLCFCRFTIKDIAMTVENMLNTSISDVVTCICFLPSELKITPHALKYEMFRYFGISLKGNERANIFNRWHYRAVCDCNTFFFFLKYLIKMKLGKVTEAYDTQTTLSTLVTKTTNVRHIDVGCNLIAFNFCSVAPVMLLYLTTSWLFMTKSLEQMTSRLSTRPLTGDLKQTQYQFNAAKLHALVLLYNTWFARKPPKINFCFNCFVFTYVKLQTCSMCQIATYCSAQCKSDNWKIHKKVCKIVKLKVDINNHVNG